MTVHDSEPSPSTQSIDELIVEIIQNRSLNQWFHRRALVWGIPQRDVEDTLGEFRLYALERARESEVPTDKKSQRRWLLSQLSVVCHRRRRAIKRAPPVHSLTEESVLGKLDPVVEKILSAELYDALRGCLDNVHSSDREIGT